jgi:CD109 antigen
MMALNDQSGYLDTVSGAREYLLAHRSSLGGFFSTQDTVVALQSLRSVSTRSMGTMDIQIIVEDVVVGTVSFDEDNAHLAAFVDLQEHLNESTVNEIRLQSTGTGRVYYTVTKSQYLPWWVIGVERPQELDLQVSYDSTDIKVHDTITAHLTMEYLGSAGMLKMILIDVRAPAGFAFIVEDLNMLVEEGKISSFELADRQALLYVTDVLPNQKLSLDYHLRATMPLKGTIQGVKAFDMYDPDLTVEVDPIDIRVTDP